MRILNNTIAFLHPIAKGNPAHSLKLADRHPIRLGRNEGNDRVTTWV